MGRFNHEAVAVDPVTGHVYETEDRGDASLYRFVPDVPGDLSKGGQLQALAIGEASYDTRQDGSGTAYGKVSWVPVDDADPETDTVRAQAQARGAAVFGRLEGAWFGNNKVYVITTNGGPAQQGQVFELDPETDEFSVLFASPGAEVLNAPDNMCVEPSRRARPVRGRLRAGVRPWADDRRGDLPLRRERGRPAWWRRRQAGRCSRLPGSEWAGSVFEPKTGNWLFVNLQSPGITLAITGPWRQGAL